MVNIKPVSHTPPAAATPLFGLPLTAGVECGTCRRFDPINPFTVETGRCTGKYKPGFINRHATGCPLHKEKGT